MGPKLIQLKVSIGNAMASRRANLDGYATRGTQQNRGSRTVTWPKSVATA